MKKLLYIILCFSCTGALFGNSNPLDLKGLIKLSDSHSSKIIDLQYDYEVNMRPNSDPSYIQVEKVSYSCLPAMGWEKESITIEIKHGEKQEYSYNTRSWNGEINKSFASHGSSLEGLNTDPQRGARKSSRKDSFCREGILEMMGLRDGEESDIKPYLYGNDIRIEGETQINGRRVLMVSSNMIDNFPRKDSLVYKYWLDLERGAIPVRVELYTMNRLRRVVEDIKIEEVSPDIYFPVSCKMKNIVYSGESSGIWSEGHTAEYKVDIKSIRVNSGLKKEDFDVEFEYNVPVWDTDIGLVYMSESNEGQTGKSLNNVSQNSELTTDTIISQSPTEIRKTSRVVIYVSITVFIILFIALITKKTRDVNE